MVEARFLAGRELSHRLALSIEPPFRSMFPRLPLALALIGAGSDVLGYDTERSMDHDWGPRLTIVVPDVDCDEVAARLDAAIDQLIPAEIAGFPTRFSRHADGTTYPDASGTVHRLHVTSVQRILRESIGIDLLTDLTPAVWLTTPMQSLLEVTAGAVFVDDAQELTSARAALSCYPEDILRYQLAALWMRVSQIHPFIGRTGEVGDEAGSAIIAANIARDFMRIGLLQSGQYAPYAKWLGTSISTTDIGAMVTPDLITAVHATNWEDRETAINRAGAHLIRQLNGLELIAPVPDGAVQFHSRPFHILPAEDIAHALQTSLADSAIGWLPQFVGGIDFITDSTDALKSRELRFALRALFTHPAVN